MNNIIIKNFFSESELDDLKLHIYKIYNFREKKELSIEEMQSGMGNNFIVKEDYAGRGRMDGLSFNELPSSVKSKILNFEKEQGNSAELNGILFGRFSKEFGLPRLDPHKDDHYWDLTLDIQIDSNIDWPLVIDGEEYTLKNNDALIFDSAGQVHWRKPQKFNENDYLDVILFHFVTNKADKEKTVIEKRKDSIAWRTKYKEEFYKAHNIILDFEENNFPID
jgi:hypothetical protein